MPDALSKTIPIWCSVLNRALFPDRSECHDLHTPTHLVSPSEHQQISNRLQGFVRDFLGLGLDLNGLRDRIAKPLRPLWVTPESDTDSFSFADGDGDGDGDEDEVFEDYHPIICCTASRRVVSGEVSEGGYIQGSGDDTENWALGLTSDVFWANVELFLSSSEGDLLELIPKLVASSSASIGVQDGHLMPILPTSSLYITSLIAARSLSLNTGRLLISLIPEVDVLSSTDLPSDKKELRIPIGPHKLGSRQLRTVLPTIIDSVCQRIEKDSLENDSVSKLEEIIIACYTGKDHSIGVGLALLCLFYDDDGRLQRIKRDDFARKGMDKLFIRRRLAWIMTAKPDANPSGATLQSVNSYLMKPPS